VLGELGVHPDQSFVAPVQTEAVSDTATADLIRVAVEAAVKAAFAAQSDNK
jgi:hypothetical protein